MMHTIEIPKPHGKKQELIMSAFHIPGLLELWVSCGTKFGKSFADAGALVSAAPLKRQSMYRWVAPIFAQTQIGFNYCRRMLPSEPLWKPTRHPVTSLVSRDLETVVEFRSGKYPEDLEGEQVQGGYVLDEAAKMHEQVYQSAKTTVSITRAPILVTSTPKGKNWFYKKCMEVKEEMEWDIKAGRVPTKIFITAPSTDNPLVTAQAVEDARRSLPERLFRQYYLAEFMDDGSVFTGYRDCLKDDNIISEEVHWVAPGSEEREVVIGADWAKHSDYTVFTALSYKRGERPELVGFMRFHGQPYTQAVQELVIFSRKFKSVGVVYHDKTGVGDAIDDLLGRTSLSFEGVVFTANSKAAMVNQLIVTFERKGILIPYWPELLKELDSFEVTTSSIGTMKYEGASGTHDDIICSLLLSNYAYMEFSGETSIQFLEDLPSSKLTVDKLYKDMIDDDEEDPIVSMFQSMRLK